MYSKWGSLTLTFKVIWPSFWLKKLHSTLLLYTDLGWPRGAQRPKRALVFCNLGPCYNRMIYSKIFPIAHPCGRDRAWWRREMETFSALLTLCVGIYRSPMNSPHKGQWRWTLMFSLICAWTNGWVNNRDASDLRRHRAHYDVTVMCEIRIWSTFYFCQHYVVCSIVTERDRIEKFATRLCFFHRIFILPWIKINPSRISNYIHHSVWDETTCPFTSFRGWSLRMDK